MTDFEPLKIERHARGLPAGSDLVTVTGKLADLVAIFRAATVSLGEGHSALVDLPDNAKVHCREEMERMQDRCALSHDATRQLVDITENWPEGE